MDNGTLTIHPEWYYHDRRVKDLIIELSFWLKQGVIIEHGIVSEKDSKYLKTKFREKSKELSPAKWKDFISLPKNRFPFNEEDLFVLEEASQYKYGDRTMLESRIKEMNGEQILGFLKELNEEITKPRTLDFSKGLIFVVGNLDEVYHDSKEFSPDLSPDVFYRNSQRLTLSQVKKALLNRFRPEQIARLGNNHIIYPSLNTEAYRKIIDLHLKEIQIRVIEKSGLKIEFDPSISEWIFQEGVVPTQGVRPLKSTIRYGLEGQIPIVLLDALSLSETVDVITLKYEEGNFCAEFWKPTKLILSKPYRATEKTKPYKESRKDDLQAITAVHETGHAIVLIDQLGILPDQVISVASESGTEGLINFESRGIISIDYVKRRIPILLAGFEAEKLIFGKEHVTDGSSDDIQRATDLVMKVFKHAGFGPEILHFALCVDDYNYSYHDFNHVENEAKEFIEKSKKRAQTILEREKPLLLEMAAKLAEYPKLSTKEVSDLVEKFGSIELISGLESKGFGYRNSLLEAIESARSARKKHHEKPSKKAALSPYL
ncbi:M41 family metallopeptidase [Algoriphagus marincola]|uniref:hypothetical protein n=1 Tax=Algoriphagus marincola TaxID=264027 RepID=UPI001FEAB756|nr:hypothetical protein [Algoriphagus marincola]